jgi:hypothetical protein
LDMTLPPNHRVEPIAMSPLLATHPDRLAVAHPYRYSFMRNLIYSFLVVVAILSGIEPCVQVYAAECQTIEGEIQVWNGWPPWIRIESKDKKHVFGIETNDEVSKSDFMPESLLKALYKKPTLTGTFCVTLTGSRTTVPHDDRVIKYVKVVSYRLEQKR